MAIDLHSFEVQVVKDYTLELKVQFLIEPKWAHAESQTWSGDIQDRLRGVPLAVRRGAVLLPPGLPEGLVHD